MPHLIVVRDVLRGGRAIHELEPGAKLSRELMRLFPDGFDLPWRIYKGEAIEDCELPAVDLPRIEVEDTDYVLVMLPAGPLIAGVNFMQIFWAFVISAAIGYITYLLTPKPKKPNSDENVESPNNQIAGQSNQLRAGARVPDILGRVRSYPDLLCNPIETWTERQQSIRQWFVIGVGNYTVEEVRLGETPKTSISGMSYDYYTPGDGVTPGEQVPEIQCVRASPEVNGMSLITQNTTDMPVGVVDFVGAPTNTMSTSVFTALGVGQFISITGTINNNNIFQVTSVPPDTQTVGPWVYGLGSATVTTENDANARISLMSERQQLNINAFPRTTPPSDALILSHLTMPAPLIGNVVRWTNIPPYGPAGGIANYIGIVTEVVNHRGDMSVPVEERYMYIRMDDLNGNPFLFTSYGPPGNFFGHFWEYTITTTTDPPPAEGEEENRYTDWFVVPIENPDVIWVDIAFPSGLLKYDTGTRKVLGIGVQIEFRRQGATAAQALRSIFREGSTSGYMRWTLAYPPGDLALPAGSGWIEVRLKRTTPFLPDTDTIQYVQDTEWARLAGVRILPRRFYPEVTVLVCQLTNTSGASSIGQTSFNAVVTRHQRTWTGSALTAAATPTQKWADNLVGRMLADDGAHKLESEIDLAGIYAIQALLDAMDPDDDDDPSSAQGKISMTLDQQTDIDTELQLIAQLVRASVYRIGRKLYVTRDQGGKTPLALFTGRSKHPDGEQVSLSIKNDSEPDAVVVQWFDRTNGWKLREFQFPTDITPLNEFRVAPAFATWAQAWRRSQYEWNRIRLRREGLSMLATEEARLINVGDVINVADDVANLAQTAGEIIAVSVDLVTLELDKPVDLSAGGFTMMLRGQDSRSVDVMPVAAGADAKHVVLSRIAAFPIKGRDDSLGTIYAIYQASAAQVLPWLVTAIEPQETYTRIVAANWREDVYAGDTAPLDPQPLLLVESEARDETQSLG